MNGKLDVQTFNLPKSINNDLEKETRNILVAHEQEMKTAMMELKSEKRVFNLQEELTSSQAAGKN